MTDSPQSIFISYSRRDKVFVRRLFDALETAQRSIWVDWEGIPYSAEWWKEICEGIEKSDTFIFVVTPDSLGSKVCNDELAYARQMNKQIVPVIRRPIDEKIMAGVWFNKPWEVTARQNWEALQKINWLFFRRKDEYECEFVDGEILNPDCDGPDSDRDPFATAFESLIATTETDLEHIKMHTRLLIRAREWEVRGQNPSLLLRGDDLRAAVEWLAQAGQTEPLPTAFHKQYVEASAKWEAEEQARDAATARRVRTLNRATIGLLVVGVLALAATVFASLQAINAGYQSATATVAQGRAIVGQQVAVDAANTATVEQGRAIVGQQTAVSGANIANTAESVAQKTLAPIPATLTPIPITLTAAGQLVKDASLQADSLKWAALANNELLSSSGNAETAALLALRALNIAYTPQADSTLSLALDQLYTRQMFEPNPRKYTINTPSTVKAVAFSPDGTLAAIRVSDLIQIWNIKTGKLVNSLHVTQGNGGFINAAFLPDNKTLMVADASVVITFWDLATFKPIHSFGVGKALNNPVKNTANKAVLSPDGKIVLVAGASNSVYLVDTTLGSTLNTLEGYTGYIENAAFSADSKIIATNSSIIDQTIQFWDSTTGKALQAIHLSSGGPHPFAFSPDGKTILVGDGAGNVQLWDTATGTQKQNIVGVRGAVESVAFSPDRTKIFAGSFFGVGYVFDAGTGKLLRTLTGHNATLSDAQFSPDSQALLTASEDGTARLWNINSPVPHTLQAPKGVVQGDARAVAFAPDSKTFFTSGSDPTIQQWDAITGAPLRQFVPKLDAFTVNNPRLLDPRRGDTTYAFSISSMAVSPDGNWIATATYDNVIELWNTHTNQPQFLYSEHMDQITSMAFSPDSKMLLTGSLDKTAELFDLTNIFSIKPYRIFTENKGSIYGVAFAPDGKSIVTASGGATEYDSAVLWDIGTGQMRLRFLPPKLTSFDYANGKSLKNMFRAVAFSPDGKTVATGHQDGTVRLWQVDNGGMLRTFLGHTNIINSVAFSPDGKLIATGSVDHTARLWDVTTGKVVRLLEGHVSQVSSVAFSPDGKTVITGSYDRVRIWNVDYHDFVAFACSRVTRDFYQTVPKDERKTFGITDQNPTCPQFSNGPKPVQFPGNGPGIVRPVLPVVPVSPTKTP
ncbi:MAG: TIR domain-containing protein [Chloroflexota bacterium]